MKSACVDMGKCPQLMLNCKRHVFMQGFPGGSNGEESACNEGSIPELERSPGGGQGNPLQHACLENARGQRSLAGYSCEESDTTERLSIAQHICHA